MKTFVVDVKYLSNLGIFCRLFPNFQRLSITKMNLLDSLDVDRLDIPTLTVPALVSLQLNESQIKYRKMRILLAICPNLRDFAFDMDN